MSRTWLKAIGWLLGAAAIAAAVRYADVLSERYRGAAAWMEVASGAERRGNWGSAITAYQEALRVDPKYMPARMGLADAYSAQGDIDRALREHWRGVLMDQRNPEAYRALASFCIRHHRYAEAIKVLKRAEALDPGDYSVRMLLVHTYRWNGQFRQALRELTELDLMRPGLPALRRVRAATDQEARRAYALKHRREAVVGHNGRGGAGQAPAPASAPREQRAADAGYDRGRLGSHAGDSSLLGR